MGDLTSIFGDDGFDARKHVGKVEEAGDPIRSLCNSMLEHGIDPPMDIITDGKIHRFDGNTGRKANTCWYVLHDSDGYIAGAFGDWRECSSHGFMDGRVSMLNHEERDTLEQLRIASRQQAEKDRKAAQDQAAKVAMQQWQEAQEPDSGHQYLRNKEVGAHNVRVDGRGKLVIPLVDSTGKLVSIQTITDTGKKMFLKDAQVKGAMHVIGDVKGSDRLFICEGYATAASIHEATGRACIAAMSASNIVDVAVIARERLGDSAHIVVVADADESGVGARYAEKAKAETGVDVIIPEEGDANDYANGGGDLCELLGVSELVEEPWIRWYDSLVCDVKAIDWLVEGWIPSEGLAMVHAPSGAGKTFFIMELAMAMATGRDMVNGMRIKPGRVIYLAGEGHHGISLRLKAWGQSRGGAEGADLGVSSSGCDLDTLHGYIKVKKEMESLDKPPAMIVVDTLHRFMSGDENSAKDTKVMLDNCNRIQQAFNCSVVLVHHTGVDESSHHRARGSSAWRGALDTEISLAPPKEKGGAVMVRHLKSKDSELCDEMSFKLEGVTIDGVLDMYGESATSALLDWCDPKEAEKEAAIAKEEDKTQKALNTIKSAYHTNPERRLGEPYISWSVLFRYLTETEGRTETSAKQQLKPSCKSGMIRALIDNNKIKSYGASGQKGWTITDGGLVSQINLIESSNDKG